MRKLKHDLSGKTFYRLTVIERVFDGKQNVRWKCLCECGNETISITGNLISGKHKSCGCWREGPTNHKHKEKIVQNGYTFVILKGHPRANKYTNRVREHILVMEEMIGRHLLPDEQVHHLNADRSDNRPENLELWTRSQPSGARKDDQVKWAIKILKRYAPELLK
jgi:hypothetical protein